MFPFLFHPHNSRILRRQVLQYSFLFSPQGSPDLKAAKEVADYLGTVHHEFHFTVQVFSTRVVEKFAKKKKNVLVSALLEIRNVNLSVFCVW